SIALSANTEAVTRPDRRYVPFDPRIVDNRLWVLNVPPGSPLQPGEEILAINGRPWSEIQATLYDRLAGDGQIVTRKRHYLNYDFGQAYNLWIEDADSYVVSCRAPDSTHVIDVVVEGISPAHWAELPGEWWAADLDVGHHEFHDDHAYLYI